MMKKILFYTAFILFTFTSRAQIDLKKNLMLYLPFNGNVLDEGPNANNGINSGATLTTDQWGNPNSAYEFDGTDYITVPHNNTLVPSGDFTISAKVFVKGFYNGHCHANVIMAKGVPGTPGNYTFWFTPRYNTDCTVQDTIHQVYSAFCYNNPPSYAECDVPPYIVKSQWDCITLTYNGKLQRMYVNGVLRYEISTTSVMGYSTSDLIFGYSGEVPYPYWFKGKLDEVRLYSRVLNTAELDSLCSLNDPKLGILEQSSISKLRLIGNPVKSEIKLQIPYEQLGGSFSLKDMSGRELISISSLNQTTVDVSQLTSGIYLLVYVKDNISYIAKAVKQN